MIKPEFSWLVPPSDDLTRENAERAAVGYFAQDPAIASIVLSAITPGRSGALAYTAKLMRREYERSVSLQPEFVKFAKDDQEVKAFREHVAGTELVFGQELARNPHADPQSGYTVFGYKLFESGTDLVPFFSVAQESPRRACALLQALCLRLQSWYGASEYKTATVTLGLTDDRITQLSEHLSSFSVTTAEKVRTLLLNISSSGLVGSVTQVHGDLHLDNILIQKSGDRCYLIDFANAAENASPYVDLARLEADILYRTLPYDLTPEDTARVEEHLWTDNPGIDSFAAEALIRTLRQSTAVASSPNKEIWLLTGRIINALRMLGNTWPKVRPYSFEQRRRCIAASIKVLASTLEAALLGRTFAGFTSKPNPPLASEGLRSVRWLYANRKYYDAFDLANILHEANNKCSAEQSLLGSIAALDSPIAPASREALYDSTTGRIGTLAAQGLKALYLAASIVRQDYGRSLAKGLSKFDVAESALSAASEPFLLSVVLDQKARCQQEFGDIAAAKISFVDAITLKERLQDLPGLAGSLGGLGLLEMSTGSYEKARELFLQDLALVTKEGDGRAEIKIHNWLGQAKLLGNLDIIGSVQHLNKSIVLAQELAKLSEQSSDVSTYSASLDLFFGHLALGFTFLYAQNIPEVMQCAERADSALQNAGGVGLQGAAALLELQTAMSLALNGSPRRALIRSEGALKQLRTLSKLDFCDYSVRAIRFYRGIGHAEIASRLADEVIGTVRLLKLATLHSYLVEGEV